MRYQETASDLNKTIPKNMPVNKNLKYFII